MIENSCGRPKELMRIRDSEFCEKKEDMTSVLEKERKFIDQQYDDLGESRGGGLEGYPFGARAFPGSRIPPRLAPEPGNWSENLGTCPPLGVHHNFSPTAEASA